MKFRLKKRDDPRPELTGLVDILFLLIIFFTITTTFASSGGIDVNLPESSSQRSLEKVDKLFVIIDKDGNAFVDGVQLGNKDLRARFAEVAAKSKDALIIIQADKLALHGRVVAIMDLANGLGLKRIAIATEQKEPKPGSPTPTPAPEPISGSTQ